MTTDDPAGATPANASAAGSRRRWPWLVAAVALLAGAGAGLAYWFRGPEPAGPLSGMLAVYVRGSERAAEALPVEEAGALPARAGGIMALDVRLNRPVFTYLVWLDGEGRAVPLYPWNYDQPDVTDINAPPPKRIATKMLMSPPLGGGWPFNDHDGMETVLFLVRATPLPEGTSVGTLLGDLPPPAAVRDPKELLILEVRDHAKTVTTVTSKNRGDEKEATAADEPLKALLLRLSPHFDLVRAVRFAHVAE
jgi:hypothetical protein